MSSYYLTVKAKEDFKSIGRYTEKTWGRKQRYKYNADLVSCFQRLAGSPELGRPCDEIRKGYRVSYAGRHVVYYRIMANEIEIVRILHRSMDARSHLSDNS